MKIFKIIIIILAILGIIEAIYFITDKGAIENLISLVFCIWLYKMAAHGKIKIEYKSGEENLT